MTVGAIIQARMGSTRLPGKVLADIGGRTMLARVVERTRHARTIQRVIVATTTREDDDAVAVQAAGLGVDVFRGSEHDVLDRYCRAARQYSLDVVARITSDCPLIDPDVIDDVVRPVLDRSRQVEFCANTLDRTFPRGLDVEVATAGALARLMTLVEAPADREHVFPYIYRHRQEFSVESVRADVDRSHMRWTVDTPEDLAFVREIYRAFGSAEFRWRDVVAFVDQRPDLSAINGKIRQKAPSSAV